MKAVRAEGAETPEPEAGAAVAPEAEEWEGSSSDEGQATYKGDPRDWYTDEDWGLKVRCAAVRMAAARVRRAKAVVRIQAGLVGATVRWRNFVEYSAALQIQAWFLNVSAEARLRRQRSREREVRLRRQRLVEQVRWKARTRIKAVVLGNLVRVLVWGQMVREREECERGDSENVNEMTLACLAMQRDRFVAFRQAVEVGLLSGVNPHVRRYLLVSEQCRMVWGERFIP